MLTIKNIDGNVMYNYTAIPVKKVKEINIPVPILKNKTIDIKRWYSENQCEVDYILDIYLSATDGINNSKYYVYFNKNSLRDDLIEWIYDGRA